MALKKEDKLILEALRYLLFQNASDDTTRNNVRKGLIEGIGNALNPKKQEFPEVKETLKEKPKGLRKYVLGK